MTWFEELAQKLGVLEKDEKGFYTGKCQVLYNLSVDVMLSDLDYINSLSDEDKESIIINNFYEIFPYMKR